MRPHPHIGLATLTYLFDGAMEHRDSTGAVQRIEPGAVNWMTAGRGIVHSERTPADLRGRTHTRHGLQLWAALPVADEALEPSFAHTPAAAIPELEVGGAVVRVLVGSAFDATSPVAVRSPTLAIDIALAAEGPARVVLIGGDPLGRRLLWWNFVATRREPLAEAAAAWAGGPGAAGDAAARFAQVPGESEFIPAPPFPAV